MAEPRRLSRLCEVPRSTLRATDPGSFVVALSGGADSAAAAWLAVDSDRPTIAVHVHHGAPGSDVMEAAASAIADRLGIACTVVRVDVPAGASYEAQARLVRHDALLEELDAGAWLVTGHTRDDQVETVLMRLMRGTGIDGLAGMARVEHPYLRPLLDVSRSDAREIATLAGLRWRDDPANRDPHHLRNRVRRDLLPMIRTRFGPGLETSLHRSADVIRRDIDVLERLAGNVERVERNGSIELLLSDLEAVGDGIAARAIRAAIRTIDPPYPPAARVVESALDVARGVARRAEIGTLVMSRSRGYLVFETITTQ